MRMNNAMLVKVIIEVFGNIIIITFTKVGVSCNCSFWDAKS